MLAASKDQLSTVLRSQVSHSHPGWQPRCEEECLSYADVGKHLPDAYNGKMDKEAVCCREQKSAIAAPMANFCGSSFPKIRKASLLGESI